jgi:Uma2 family endonuclease
MAALPDTGMGPLWHLSVGQYHAMIDAGILGSGDRVELLEGVLVEKMSKNPPHSYATGETRRALDRRLPAGWFAISQEPITFPRSEPEPDVAVIKGNPRDFVRRHPGADDAELVIEISDATLDRDRILKKRIYAAAGIPFYWVLDLAHRRLEVYSAPNEGDYRRIEVYGPNEAVNVVLRGEQIGPTAIAGLLP